MTIHVTQAHIDAGAREDCRECPVALAIHEATGCTCEVLPWTIYTDRGKFKLPRAVFEFIEAFDNKQPVQPFSFEVDIPVEVRS